MKQTFNIDEEINRIKTGDTVLICGLYGKNYNFINNKFGKIKKVIIRNVDQQQLHIAEVELLKNGGVYAINFDFIYKLNIETTVDNPTQHLVTLDNAMMYYVHKKSIQHSMSIHDELGQHMAVCVDNNGKSHVILFSGIN